jgi:hypothetical protein
MGGLSCDTSFNSSMLFGAHCFSKPERWYHMSTMNTICDHGVIFSLAHKNDLPKKNPTLG